MTEPATTDREALDQMLEFNQRQVRNAEAQARYARGCLKKWPDMAVTNRLYYESEIARCDDRAAYFRPQVAALENAIKRIDDDALNERWRKLHG